MFKPKFEELNKDGTPKRKKGLVKWIVIGVGAFILVCSSFTIIPAGHTGVVMTLGKVNQNVMQEGLNFKIPFIQSVVKMSNKIQVYEVDASAVSKDLQTVSSKIAVNYRVSTDASASLYKNVGVDYKTILVTPILQESMKSATAKYTAEELITERTVVGDEIKDTLSEKLNEYGIYIEKFNIVNFDFSQEFNSAIEAKQVAEQNLIKTKTEQQQAIVVAEAEAKEKTIKANAEAEAILATAKAQAEANKMLEESLSEIVIKYEQITKWNGELPKVTGNSGNFIDMSLDDIEKSNNNNSVSSDTQNSVQQN
ncbi:MAG: prohibitin family protein [Ruminococcus sp.]|nr:prohibitin family protein [Oscillospiraceae bacterium]MDY4412793.1 prohibitin family protein [Ruminococcus sp.]